MKESILLHCVVLLFEKVGTDTSQKQVFVRFLNNFTLNNINNTDTKINSQLINI